MFNPNPYEWETEVECEFMLADQNWSDSMAYIPRVVDADGNPVYENTYQYAILKKEWTTQNA